MVYLTGEELPINAHRPGQSKKRRSHHQYPNPADLLIFYVRPTGYPSFKYKTDIFEFASAPRLVTLGLADCRAPTRPGPTLTPLQLAGAR